MYCVSDDGFGTCDACDGFGESDLEERRVNIYVGNLSFDTDDETLESTFASFG